jgi:hypothetical protein
MWILFLNLQLTESICAFSLYDKNNVNNITVENVINKNKYNEAVNFVCNHPLIE